MPIPNIVPVINRNQFLLSLLQYACVRPSTNAGNKRNKDNSNEKCIRNTAKTNIEI
jgi:hypothetical protein